MDAFPYKSFATIAYKYADAMLDAKYADEGLEPEPELGITAIKKQN
jgi:hypothetical protein